MEEANPVTLGYWNIRGLGQPIRLLLKYTGTKFNDVMYREQERGRDWFGMKFKLGLDFPNLPYLMDGDMKLTETTTIMRYIARQHDMCGNTEQERVALDILELEAVDFRDGFIKLLYIDPKSVYEKRRDDYTQKAKEKVQQFSAYLGDKQWFIGNEITYVDFYLYEILDHHRIFEPGFLDHVPNLMAFLDRFKALPAIKAYMESDDFISSPINSEFYSNWPGGKH